MKKLIILATLLAVTASQADLDWVGSTFGGSGDFADGNSWSADGGVSAAGRIPDGTDTYALLKVALAPGVWPTISTDLTGGTAAVMYVGLEAASGAQLTVANGGIFNGNQVIIAGGDGDAKLVIEDGGAFYASSYLLLSQNGTGTGNVEMTGGVLWTPNLAVSKGNVFMSGGAMFAHAGDTTGNGLENTVLLASNAGESIAVSAFDAVNNRTVYTVIPEPATFGLVAAFGGALLFVRKKILI